MSPEARVTCSLLEVRQYQGVFIITWRLFEHWQTRMVIAAREKGIALDFVKFQLLRYNLYRPKPFY